MARKLAFALALACLAAGALGWAFWPRGQGLEGRKVDYHRIYDTFWDVACDSAMDGTDRGCYVQYVDVYRPRPDFAAAMVELVYHPGEDGRPDPQLRFDIEPGLSFRQTTVAVNVVGGALPIDISQCAGNTCRIAGGAARAILAGWRAGASLEWQIDEGRGPPARLTWPLRHINAILDDLAAQRAARGLP